MAEDKAIEALRMIGTPVISLLMKSLRASDNTVRAHAAYLLGEVGKPDHKIIPILVDLLDDEHQKVKRAAEKGLKGIGELKLILFNIDFALQNDLDSGEGISEGLQKAFKENGIRLSKNAAVHTQKQGSRWLIINEDKAYTIWNESLWQEGVLYAGEENLYVSAAANIALLEHKINVKKKRQKEQIQRRKEQERQHEERLRKNRNRL
jgi:HEAT repeat protein